MGLTLAFYIGDSKEIERAIRECEIDLLYDPEVVHRQADLSLHILPKDPNLLSRQFGKHSGRKPLDLRPYLSVIIDESDRGLLLVDNTWVMYAADVEADAVDNVVEDWFEAMRKEYPQEEIQVTPEAKLAVQALLELCKAALQEGSTVLHSWFA